MPARSEPILAARSLEVWLGPERQHVVQGLDLELDEGEIVAIAGESGAGKTQAAAALIGLAGGGRGSEASGTVHFEGTVIDANDLARLAQLRGRRIAMVTQEAMASITPVRSVGDLLGETLTQVDGDCSAQRARELLGQAGFPDPERVLGSYAHELSGGMRQRVAFALALAARPRVLIADEPTTGLDFRLQRELMALLARIAREEGRSVLLISHDLSVIAQLADRTLVMRHGSVVESGPTTRLFAEPRDPYTRQLVKRNRTRRALHGVA